jgi:heat shock protein HslJ
MTRRLSTPRGVAALLASAALVGCALAPAGETARPDLLGTWLVEDLDQRGVPDRARLTVVFDGSGRMGGRAGCNDYTGTISVDRKRINIGPLATGRKLCTPALMAVEARMLRSLQGADTLGWGPGDAALLTGPEGRSLTLRREGLTASAGAADTDFGPAAATYRCGNEVFTLALGADEARLTLPDGSRATLPRRGGDNGTVRVFSNGALNLFQDAAPPGGLRLARGRMAPQDCVRLPSR